MGSAGRSPGPGLGGSAGSGPRLARFKPRIGRQSGRPGSSLADHREQRVLEAADLLDAEALAPPLFDQAGYRRPYLPGLQAPFGSAQDGVRARVALVDPPGRAVDGDVAPAAHAVQVGFRPGHALEFGDGDRLLADKPQAVLPHGHRHQPHASSAPGRAEVRRGVRDTVFGVVVAFDRERDKGLGQQGRQREVVRARRDGAARGLAFLADAAGCLGFLGLLVCAGLMVRWVRRHSRARAGREQADRTQPPTPGGRLWVVRVLGVLGGLSIVGTGRDQPSRAGEYPLGLVGRESGPGRAPPWRPRKPESQPGRRGHTRRPGTR